MYVRMYVMTHMLLIVCSMTGPLSLLLVSLLSFLLRDPPRPHPLLIPPRPHPLLPLPPSSPPIAACKPKKLQTAASLRVGNPIQQSPLLPHPHPALAWPYDPWRPGSPSDWKVSMTPRTLLRSSSFISTSPKPYLTRDSPETRKMFGLYDSSLLELRLFSQSRHNHAPA